MAQDGRSLSRRLWAGLFAVTVGFGVWGFLDLPPRVSPAVLDALYRTARLFTLNLDVDPGVALPWQLWVAALLAPLLLVRGIAELFRDRLRGIAVHFLVKPEVVVLGAGHRAAALAAVARTPTWRRWLRAVVVADPDAQRFGPVRGTGAWTVVSDGLSAAALRRAAVHRSPSVVVATGDDRRNAAVATQVQLLGRARADREIYVEVDDPGLARALEHPGTGAGAATIPFNAFALAASDVMDELDERDGPLLAPGDEQPAVALFGGGLLMDAMVLELRRRRRLQMLDDVGGVTRRPRVLLIGPDAEQRMAALRDLLGPELDLLDLTAVDDSLTEVLELRPGTARALLGHRLRRVLVLVPDDLRGGPIALTLAQHLGSDGRVALVTEGAGSTFGERITTQTTADPTLASVRLFRVPEKSYSLPRLRAHRGVDRLARALHETSTATTRWVDLDEPALRSLRATAKDLLDEQADLQLRTNAFMALDPPHVRILNALALDFTALVRAGLSPDLRRLTVVTRIARKLLDRGRDEAFEVWCEAARLATTPDQLPDHLAGSGRLHDDVRRLLLLRRCQLGDSVARQVLAADSPAPPATDRLTVVVGGPAGEPPAQLRDILEWALTAPALTGSVVEPPGSTGTGETLRTLAAASGGTFTVASPGPDVAAARRFFLDLCARYVLEVRRRRDARTPTGEPTIRVLAVPGGPDVWPQLHVLRALSAPIGWLPTTTSGPAPDPAHQLLGGAAGVVTLPEDRATVRAFLRPSRWPDDDTSRDLVAAALHDAYRHRHGTRKPPGDPAMRPFPQLPPALQDSNRAIVADIPAKLAAVGLRLRPVEDAAWPPDWPDDATLDLLAEMEHGRWNAERLLAGWEAGTRDTTRFVSPHLKPWHELEQTTRDWSRDIIRDLPAALGSAAMGAAPRAVADDG